MMFATCLAAVAVLMNSSLAMALLLCPLATSATTSCSLGVSMPGGAVTSRSEPSAVSATVLSVPGPEPVYRGPAEMARGGQVLFLARAGQRRQAGHVAQRGGGGGQLHRQVRPVFAHGQGRKRLQPAGHADARPGGL